MKEAYLVICASTGQRRCRAALCGGGDCGGGGGGLTKRQTQNLLLAREDTTNLVCSMYSAIRFGPNSVFQNSFYGFEVNLLADLGSNGLYVDNKMC